jgi:hypothetical protein
LLEAVNYGKYEWPYSPDWLRARFLDSGSRQLSILSLNSKVRPDCIFE